MASPEQVRLAQQYRTQQALVSATLAADLIVVLRALFSPADLGRSWKTVRSVIATLVRDRRRLSANLADSYYRRARPADAAGRMLPVPPAELVAERLETTIDVTGIATYTRAVRAGATPIQARDRMAVTLSGAGSRLALEGGRSVIEETVREDEAAIGWARVTDADPCPWCLMMASRGAAYRNAKTAGGSADRRFVGEGDFKFHDHCGCQAVPAWSTEDPILDRAADLYDQWLAVTTGHSGKGAVNAWRRYWDTKRDGQPEEAALEAARTGGHSTAMRPLATL